MSPRTASLESVDSEISQLIRAETERQEYGLEMIPSENFVSEAVLEAAGSVLTNKYAEGLPGKRYYGGCEFVDEVENLARSRVKELFGAEFANVQAHSGASANLAVFEAFLDPGDTIMGMRLDQGGHLTHGSPVNFSGRRYNVIAYGVRESDHYIDDDEVFELAKEHKPKMIICGASAYSRKINFEAFRRAADAAGAILLGDVAHYAGLIAAGVYPSPVEHCDVITSTTHKTLRGPRSGIILGKKEHAKKLNKSISPGLQGGPLMHIIAAKAVAFKEALQPEFKVYSQNVIDNARALAAALEKLGFKIVSGGTDSHVMLVDLRPLGLTGKVASETLDQVGITLNKNTIPFDPEPPMVCSGVRLGTPAITTRGMGIAEMETIASLMKQALEAREDEATLQKLREEVRELSGSFPLYRHRLV